MHYIPSIWGRWHNKRNARTMKFKMWLKCDCIYYSDQFLNKNVSQRNVATCLRCGEIFNHQLIANLLLSPMVNEIWQLSARVQFPFCDDGVQLVRNICSTVPCVCIMTRPTAPLTLEYHNTSGPKSRLFFYSNFKNCTQIPIIFGILP